MVFEFRSNIRLRRITACGDQGWSMRLYA